MRRRDCASSSPLVRPNQTGARRALKRVVLRSLCANPGPCPSAPALFSFEAPRRSSRMSESGLRANSRPGPAATVGRAEKLLHTAQNDAVGVATSITTLLIFCPVDDATKVSASILEASAYWTDRPSRTRAARQPARVADTTQNRIFGAVSRTTKTSDPHATTTAIRILRTEVIGFTSLRQQPEPNGHG